MDLMKMDVLRCDGRTAESVRRLGDVIGHVTPGVALAGWGLHVFLGACWRHALSQRDPSAPGFFARTWEPLLPFLPSTRWQRFNQLVPVDTLYKVLFGGFLIVCTDGVRYGRIVGQHIVRWAHSTLITSYVAVGLVELMSFRTRFPDGFNSAALVAAHIVTAIIFMGHQKHELTDQTAHALLGYCFLGAAGCGVIEAACPKSFMAVTGKLFFHILGGLWLAIVGCIIFGKSLFWSPVWEGQPDVGPAMFIPVLFGQIMLGLVIFMALVYCAVDLLAAWRLRQQALPRAHGGHEAGASSGFALLALGRRGPEESQALLAGQDEAPAAGAALVGDVQLGGYAVGPSAGKGGGSACNGGALHAHAP
ncbi:hypothetical protein GPECTOR_56g360 [Gonium pectorale]|uniref:Uncharacterized protein n=1 Tax=Gonium pectorale TaxID=33097 RepID=A0A150G618_GONPE|nr:hypothetical protein GPECTOR_56g360 [Gonium pectorale]|eukprot:KXZ45264.1 hypothetical protein GPECTOR_56g360 [Gonium pectorale]